MCRSTDKFNQIINMDLGFVLVQFIKVQIFLNLNMMLTTQNQKIYNHFSIF